MPAEYAPTGEKKKRRKELILVFNCGKEEGNNNNKKDNYIKIKIEKREKTKRVLEF